LIVFSTSADAAMRLSCGNAAKRLNLLRESGVIRSGPKSRNYAISGRRSHRSEQGLASGADRRRRAIAPN
jgi:hypothetical protein